MDERSIIPPPPPRKTASAKTYDHKRLLSAYMRQPFYIVLTIKLKYVSASLHDCRVQYKKFL